MQFVCYTLATAHPRAALGSKNFHPHPSTSEKFSTNGLWRFLIY